MLKNVRNKNTKTNTNKENETILKLLCENNKNENERIQDVDQDLSSNTFPSIVEEMEDNHLELLVSILDLCFEN
jgi:hypothetical protein